MKKRKNENLTKASDFLFNFKKNKIFWQRKLLFYCKKGVKMEDKYVQNFLKQLLDKEVEDSFYGHRGRSGQRGGSLPRTEHTTKHGNSQYEAEAGTYGISINKIMKSAKLHKYTAKEHKQMKDRALVVVSGDQIPDSKFKGMQLYRYNKKDRCLESSYGDNPKLYLKDLKGKQVRVFQPTSDTVNKDTVHAVRRKRVKNAFAENETDRINRLAADTTPTSGNTKAAIRGYTGSGSWLMNSSLRTTGVVNKYNGKIEGRSISKAIKNKIEVLDNHIGTTQLKQDTALYRMCDADGVLGVFGDALQEMNLSLLDFKDSENNAAHVEKCLKALKGKTGQELGFMSTSASKDFVKRQSAGGFEYEIFAPKGTHAIYVEGDSSVKGEQEMLCQRGTKFLMTGYKKVKRQGKTTFVLKVQVVN